MLRGPQTPGELKGRSERLRRFADLAEIEGTLSALAERELVVRLARRPGQKEERYAHLLGGDESARDEPAGDEQPTAGDDRLGEVERTLAELREEVASLRSELAALRDRSS
jgi:uncharacterized protein YceH (UPF0502 family)